VRAEHWEPPDPPKLLISARRVALELDIPHWQANEICWSLERVFYAPGQVHYRVTRRSFESLKSLVDRGLTPREARNVIAYFRGQGRLPPDDLTDDDLEWYADGLNQRRRRRWREL